NSNFKFGLLLYQYYEEQPEVGQTFFKLFTPRVRVKSSLNDVHAISSELHLVDTFIFPVVIKPSLARLTPFLSRPDPEPWPCSECLHTAGCLTTTGRVLTEGRGCTRPPPGMDNWATGRDTTASGVAKTPNLEESSSDSDAHCLEEENGSLECQIADLEENLNGQPASTEITSTAAKPKFSLEAVVEKLRRQRDEIICDTEELKEELECLQKEFEKAAHQRIVVQQGQQDAAEAVDAVTAECLALRDQVAVYEEQLANMETQHKMEVESQLQPDERALAAAVVRFGSPDITPVWEVKEYHRQLAESLQLEFGALSSGKSDGKKLEARGTSGSMVKDPTEITDVDEMKTLISELQKELDDLEKSNEELLDEVEVKGAAYMDEVEELEVWDLNS
ncbi:hypothetical protein CCH79_00005692, partial [Gambusia affinis]